MMQDMFSEFIREVIKGDRLLRRMKPGWVSAGWGMEGSKQCVSCHKALCLLGSLINTSVTECL